MTMESTVRLIMRCGVTPRLLLLLAAVGAASPGSTGAQGTESLKNRAAKGAKLRMALIPVDKQTKYEFTKPMIAASFEDAMLKAGRFATLSRSEMGAIRSEQALSASGSVDPASAVRLGRMLAANYVIVVRQLAFDLEETKNATAKIIGIGKSRSTYTVNLQAQAIDVETSEIVNSKSFSKQFETSKMVSSITMTDGNGKNVTPKDATEKSIVGPYQDALKDFAESFTSELAAAIPLEAIVVAIEDANNVAIDAGSEQGLKAGARFELIEEGLPIKRPDGTILGYRKQTVGLAEVVRVEAKLAWLKLTQTMKSGTPDPAPDVSRIKQYVTAKMVGGPK
jgi:curli biogenesis system outer membrane secretion channel CsgG